MKNNKYVFIIINSLVVLYICLMTAVCWYGVSMNFAEGDFVTPIDYTGTLLARMDIVLSVWLLMQLAGLAVMNFVVYAFRHNQYITTLWIVVFTLIVVVIPFLAAALFPVDWLATIML